MEALTDLIMKGLAKWKYRKKSHRAKEKMMRNVLKKLVLVMVLFGAMMFVFSGCGEVINKPSCDTNESVVVDINSTNVVLVAQLDGKKRVSDLGERLFFKGISFFSEGDIITDLNLTFKVKSDLNVDQNDLKLKSVALYRDGEKVSDSEEVEFSSGVGNVVFDDIVIREGISEFTVIAEIGRWVPGDTVYKMISINALKPISQENEEGEVRFSMKVNTFPSIFIRGAKIVAVMNDEKNQVDSDDDAVISQITFNTDWSGEDIEVQRIDFIMELNSSTANFSDVEDCFLSTEDDIRISDREDVSDDGKLSFETSIFLEAWSKKTIYLICELEDEFFSNDSIDVKGSFEAEGQYTDIEIKQDIQNESGVQVSEELYMYFDYDVEAKAILVGDVAVASGYMFISDNGVFVNTISGHFTNIGNAISAINVGDQVRLYIDNVEVSIATVSENGDIIFNVEKAIYGSEWADIEVRVDTERDGEILMDSFTISTETKSISDDNDDVLIKVVNALPVITELPFSDTNLSTEDDKIIFQYNVKAEGGDVKMKDVVWSVYSSKVVFNNARVIVYDNPNMNGTAVAEISVNIDTYIHVDLDTVINENDTYYIFVIADITTTGDDRYVDLVIYNQHHFEWDGYRGSGMLFSDGVSDFDSSLIYKDSIYASLYHWR